MSFPPYPTYKDSGVDWLGAVPEHWKSKRLKFLFNLVKREVREEDRIVTCFRDGEVTLRDNRRTDGFTNALKEIGYQGIRSGDLVIHAMDAFAGAIGVSDSDGKSSPVYSVCTPASPSVSASYYALLLRNMAIAGFVTSLAKGIRERSTDFRWADASEIFLPAPSYEEQREIVSFLDHETTRIDALIEEQQRLIELLKEKRQAVISHAVTKGLDPTVPMKDSGVEWLGEVPAHWSVVPFGLAFEYQEGPGIMAVDFRDEGVPLVRISGVQSRWVTLQGCNYLDPVKANGRWGHFRLEKGDLIISGSASMGLVSEVGEEAAGAISYTGLIRLKPKKCISCRDFIRSVVSSYQFFVQIDLLKAGSTIQHFGPTHLSQMKVVLPPIDEQIKVATYVDKVSIQFDQLLGEAEKTNDLLQERRSALISAAVTGKIDVRGWQPPASAATAEQQLQETV